MTKLLHRCICNANDIINIVSPVVPLWAVVQCISAYNEDDGAPTTWADQIFPVHAIGTMPPFSAVSLLPCQGAFLVADPRSGSVAWLTRHHDIYKPEKGREDITRVFFVNEMKGRGQYPCPTSWRCAEYDPTDQVMGIF